MASRRLLRRSIGLLMAVSPIILALAVYLDLGIGDADRAAVFRRLPRDAVPHHHEIVLGAAGRR